MKDEEILKRGIEVAHAAKAELEGELRQVCVGVLERWRERWGLLPDRATVRAERVGKGGGPLEGRVVCDADVVLRYEID